MATPKPHPLSVLAFALTAHQGFAQTPPTDTAAASKTERRQPEAPRSDELELTLNAAFDRARSFFSSGLFPECVESYQQLFDSGQVLPEGIPNETVEQGRLYYASCLFADGQPAAAEEQIRAAMRANPLMAAPDPVVFPTQVQDLFFRVKADFLDEVQRIQDDERQRQETIERERRERREREQERVRELERLAGQESIVAKNERWVAAIPFGVGQFQNGDATLGAAFLATEAILLTATVAAVSVQLGTHSQADGGDQIRDSTPFNDQLTAAHTVELWAGAGFFLTAGLGILEAQLSFVPEHRLGSRSRAIPKSESVSADNQVEVEPSFTPGPGGGVLGVMGRF